MARVTILPDEKVIEANEGESLLELSERAGALHGALCGGVGACGACHVYVKSGGDALAPATERELDTLEHAFAPTDASRLGCLAKVGRADLTFEISRESLGAWLDEHAEERHRFEREGVPDDLPAELRARLARLVRKE